MPAPSEHLHLHPPRPTLEGGDATPFCRRVRFLANNPTLMFPPALQYPPLINTVPYSLSNCLSCHLPRHAGFQPRLVTARVHPPSLPNAVP